MAGSHAATQTRGGWAGKTKTTHRHPFVLGGALDTARVCFVLVCGRTSEELDTQAPKVAFTRSPTIKRSVRKHALFTKLDPAVYFGQK